MSRYERFDAAAGASKTAITSVSSDKEISEFESSASQSHSVVSIDIEEPGHRARFMSMPSDMDLANQYISDPAGCTTEKSGLEYVIVTIYSNVVVCVWFIFV